MKRISNNKININSLNIKFFRKFKKFYKITKEISLILIILQTIVFSSILISEPKAASQFLEKIYRRILWSFDTLEIEDYGNYIIDFLYVLNPLKKDLERLDLSINYKNLKGLDCSRKFNSYSNFNKEEVTSENCGKYWFKGKLSYKNKIFRVKFRSKGDRDIHYRDFKNMSFKADIKGKERLNGMEEFSIQTPMIRNYTTELLAAEAIRKEDIIAPRNHYMKFYINGEYKGIRHIEEGFSRELIEFNKKRYGPLFSLEETISKNYKEAFFDLHDAKFWNSNQKQSNLANQARTILEESKKNNTYIDNYFDLDKWAKYFATIDAFRLWHASMPKSVKYFLNPTTGLIEPVFYDGHTNSSRILDNYSFYKILDKKEEQINCEFICDDEDNFYINFFGTNSNPNHIFFEKYISNLKRITSKENLEDNIEPIWDSLKYERGSLYKEFWRIDRINNPGIMPHIAPWKSIKKRLASIQNNIKKSEMFKPEITIDPSSEKILSIENKFSDIPQIIRFKCSENNYISNNYLLIKNTPVNLKDNVIDSCELPKVIYSLNNFKNSFLIRDSYVTNSDLKQKNYSDKDIKNEKDFTPKSKLLFKKKVYTFDKNLEISNKNIYFSPGTKICLKENSIIHLKKSNVYFSEDSKSPVYIGNCSDNKAGSLIIEKSFIKISNLNLNKLTSPMMNLRSLDGGLNIIDSKVEINNLISSNSFSEDGINFLNSDVNADTLEINNSFSDGIDSDFSRININNIICQNIGNDCFDSSFTLGKLGNLSALDIKDKAISIGEASDIDINNINVMNSEIGIVVKDASKVKINNFIFNNVKLAIASYIKKEEFGNPEISIGNIRSKSNQKFLISKDSTFKYKNKLQESYLTSDYIENILYGNIYGVKTKR